jgi:asparagine synthase (glutamine-hydrolysing)
LCGLAGIVHARADRPVSEAALASMRDALRHRGPDDDGILIEGPVGLCHTRLAIQDLHPRSRQPMRSASERFALVFNGEIYNFRELREQLVREGRRFRTTSDTEVILQVAETWGVDALERLEGMFALALHDRELHRVWLMRDRLGIKPLFWRQDADGVSFASEPKALGLGHGVAAPDAARVAEYLAFRNLAGEECLLSEVQTLPPGYRLVTDGGSMQLERWWRPEPAANADGAQVESCVRSAVERQLIADVPVGIFLSGGIDSALVAAVTRAAIPDVHGFTVGFAERGWDETDRARVVSDALGIRAHELRLDEDAYVRGLDEAIFYLDAPLNHAHSVHLLALSRQARRHITVAMTGEGGDELFAGYPRYRLFLLGRSLSPLPDAWLGAAARHLRGRRPRWARLLDAAARDPATAAAVNAAFVSLEEASALAGLDDPERAIARRRAIVAESPGKSPLAGLLHLERQTYLVSLLQRMDRMSMAAGLECRVPLLDEKVLAHALAIPLAQCIDRRETKKPLRRAAAERFGRAYAYAPKSGFGVPIDAWLRGDGPFGMLSTRLLEEKRTRERGLLDIDRARQLHTAHRRGELDASELLWGVVNLELWARQALDGERPAVVRVAA